MNRNGTSDSSINKSNSPAKEGNSKEEEIIKVLSEKYQKELSKLSLSQREGMVFNYIHQSNIQEDLNDVNLEDVLKITGKDEEKKKIKEEERLKRRKQLKNIIQHLKKLETLTIIALTTQN